MLKLFDMSDVMNTVYFATFCKLLVAGVMAWV